MAAAASERAAEFERHLGPFLDHLRADRVVSPSTLSAYGSDLGQFLAFLGDLEPDQPLSESTIRRFLAGLRSATAPSVGGRSRMGGSSPATVARKLAVLRTFFRYLCREGVLTDNPAALVSSPRPARGLPRLLQLDEVQELLGLPGGGPRGLRDRAVLETLYATGARLSELALADVDDIDFEGEFVRLGGPRRRERVVPLGSYARDALRRYIDLARPELQSKAESPAAKPAAAPKALFINRNGSRFSIRGLRRLVDRYLERLALERRVTADSLRQAFAGHLLDEGADIRAVQEMLGPGSLATTQALARVSQARLRAVYESAHPRARS